ncbi:rod shape-determining protein MreC [Brevifollis gellanilyticus]|uniref:Cell shape-determining protein MreC n=1 Tax=Brevifollis gellanilyticus TaxID=748831 RepID=A0A512M339_9BACT|nr:rod shape-determining protein MreC [Brevifollis gellanilyticus]GEP41159.1 cell shape-determining protein MreC [Brevifollis gellanilyticus]
MKKLNILALLIFVAAVVSVFTLDTPTTREIQSRVMSLLSPFIHSSTAIEESISNVGAPTVDPKEVKRDNERLTIEVERLRIISQKYVQTLDENNQLRELIEFKKNSAFKMTAARVIKRVSSTWWNTMIIDKGSLDGLATDTPVISSAGLIGKTGKMAPHMAEVILLTDETCRVSAKVDGTLEQGIISGERAGLDLRPDLRLRFLNRTAVLQPGATVISTGEGGIFPAGLTIGRVKRFEMKDITGEAVVEPTVDFSQLKHVFVLDAQDNTAAAPSKTESGVPKAVPVSEAQAKP